MYIRSVHIENIRSIETFDMAFEEGHEAGWHVLIGENGSGKTTIARAMALGLMGNEGHIYLRLDPYDWFPQKIDRWSNPRIKVGLIRDKNFDFLYEPKIKGRFDENDLFTDINILKGDKPEFSHAIGFQKDNEIIYYLNSSVNSGYGWFSASFGPFRRFSGGNESWNAIFKLGTSVGAHLSLFGEDVAFTELVPWLKDLKFEQLENPSKKNILTSILKFINDGELFPNNLKVTDVGREKITCIDRNGAIVDLYQLSDGYRSILSLTFELIRQLIRTYGEEKVFANIQKGEMNIALPGVVIIDEVDAHLHPTWQTKIGQWFTKYFPQLQFIVTTHSPLICRACGEHGKIFKLAAPGAETPSAEITGGERDRLVYGDILVAYETDAFGDGVEWGEESREIHKEYRELVYKKRFGIALNETDQARFDRLKHIFRSHVEVD